jgi:oxygen-dependent protoporphyrinogen oxidase
VGRHLRHRRSQALLRDRLNQASIVRGTESVRKPGGSFMTFSPASLGKALLEKSEEEVIKTHLTDLDQVLGHGFADSVVEAKSTAGR